MILGRENNTNNNERVEIELNGNLINFEPEMENQALKLPLKEGANLDLLFEFAVLIFRIMNIYYNDYCDQSNRY